MTLRNIGIAGYMGAGKSTCARFLADAGYPVFDGDREAKLVMACNQSIVEKIQDAFGDEIVASDGIDFRSLGNMVFNDGSELLRLNAIVHPVLKERLRDVIFNRTTSPVLVVDAALLPFWKIDDWFDLRIWVHAPDHVRLERLAVKKPDLEENTLVNRMKGQEILFSPPSRKEWNYIENSGDTSVLAASLKRLLALSGYR